MRYNDRFLGALGAWQKGWREDPERREPITAELLAAIGAMATLLPMRDPPPLCYRKRFLVPNNPQNAWELSQLVLKEGIHDGVASWTTDAEYGRAFKDLVRPGQITALFRHQPEPSEVVVDLPALWTDPAFAREVDEYAAGGGEYSAALLHFKDGQSELILNAPLRLEGVFGLVGEIGSYEDLFAVAGATTAGAQDELVDRIIETNNYPGRAKWLGREASQRALRRTQARVSERIARSLRRRQQAAWLRRAPSRLAIACCLALPPLR